MDETELGDRMEDVADAITEAATKILAQKQDLAQTIAEAVAKSIPKNESNHSDIAMIVANAIESVMAKQNKPQIIVQVQRGGFRVHVEKYNENGRPLDWICTPIETS